MRHSNPWIPTGMSRRHFLKHLAGASAMAIPAMSLTRSLELHADELKKNHKAAILLWMGGGPSTMDMWDLKPNAPTGGPFRPISTSGDVQICEHLPLLAKNMHHLARSANPNMHMCHRVQIHMQEIHQNPLEIFTNP